MAQNLLCQYPMPIFLREWSGGRPLPGWWRQAPLVRGYRPCPRVHRGGRGRVPSADPRARFHRSSAAIRRVPVAGAGWVARPLRCGHRPGGKGSVRGNRSAPRAVAVVGQLRWRRPWWWQMRRWWQRRRRRRWPRDRPAQPLSATWAPPRWHPHTFLQEPRTRPRRLTPPPPPGRPATPPLPDSRTAAAAGAARTRS